MFMADVPETMATDAALAQRSAEMNDDQVAQEADQPRSRGCAEPQGTRQRARGSPRYDQRPSRRREAEHPRTGLARQSRAEHQPSAVGVTSRGGVFLPSS